MSTGEIVGDPATREGFWFEISEWGRVLFDDKLAEDRIRRWEIRQGNCSGPVVASGTLSGDMAGCLRRIANKIERLEGEA